MNPWSLFPITALLVNLFVWIYVFAQQKKDPVNAAFLLFSANAMGWILGDLAFYHPWSHGHETALSRTIGIFWIPCGSWLLLFAYNLVGRKWDKLLLLSFVISIIGIAFNSFTDAIILGHRRFYWGTTQLSHPVFHPLLALGTAISSAYAVLLILHKRHRSMDPDERRALSLLIWGAIIVMGVIAITNVAIPAVQPKNAFPAFGSSAFTIFIVLVFLAVTKYRFLSISVEKVAEELFEDIRDGILLTDRSGRVVRSNSAACAILKAQVAGRDVRDLFGDLDHDFSDREIAIGPAAAPTHVSISAATTSRDGRLLGRIFLLRDITEQKSAEAVLRRSKEELEREVQERTDQLRHAQRMEAIGTLAGGIAHDFNNILAAIMGFTTAAMNDLPPSSPLKKDLDEILVASNRGREIVRQILSISRKQSQIALRPWDLTRLVQETVDLVQVSCPDTVEMRCVLPSCILPVRCDPTQLSQVLMNLTANAIHAMKEKRDGVLTIRLERTLVDEAQAATEHLRVGDAALLQVSDNGCGIEAAHLSQIFNPFFTTKPQGEGTGLGLSTSLVFIQNHQGSLRVESENERGATFSITLPLLDEAAALELTRQTILSDLLPESILGKELVLLVDDEPQIRRVGVRILNQLGYVVETADNGVDAMEKIRASQIQFDLVISDLSMPRMSGLDLARAIRSQNLDIPFILMSGYGEKVSREDIAGAKIAAFLQKPAEKRTLASAIRCILDGGETALITK